jgi:hypothetical protein
LSAFSVSFATCRGSSRWSSGSHKCYHKMAFQCSWPLHARTAT